MVAYPIIEVVAYPIIEVVAWSTDAASQDSGCLTGFFGRSGEVSSIVKASAVKKKTLKLMWLHTLISTEPWSKLMLVRAA